MVSVIDATVGGQKLQRVQYSARLPQTAAPRSALSFLFSLRSSLVSLLSSLALAFSGVRVFATIGCR